jgi:AmiR/NasT family two-component response regulator
MAERGLGEREAFLAIQHQARQQRRTMRQVAQDLLGGAG